MRPGTSALVKIAFEPAAALQRLARVRLPGADRVDLAGGQRLRRLVGRDVHQLDVARSSCPVFSSPWQQQVLDQAELEADLLALELLEALDARLGDDHVVAVAVVGDQDGTLRAPCAPVTSASPLVIMTASTLPAVNASIDGTYSNQANSTSTPASLNQPFWMPISNAVQPGQSL